MELTIDRHIYPEGCISKAVYSLSDRYAINRTSNGDSETLDIMPLEEEISEPQIKHDFLSSLNDYKLRQLIEKETHEIRIILYAKAFSDFDENE